ncbi:hypothetical protein [Bacillus thuringiensis]|uniref:hypothetical protein n=1 Tax=Bacillus thuringiensis TaxID=1428 RepID=UPI000BF6DA5E|nr:hypothetical protein [Bacillus thuringiensis]PEV64216.1 hypothetical protein CN434_25745 [Bacillus thuringiensis]
MELTQAETLNKYSFLIKCTDGTVSIASQIGETVEEVQAYVERTLNKKWSLITDTTFIKNWIAKENETRKELRGTEWFWEALDQINERISDTLNKNEKVENKMNLKEFNKVNSMMVKETGEIMSHEEFYTNVVNGIGLKTLIPLLPATKEEIKVCLERDGNLNGIKLQYWDERAKELKFYISRIGVKSISLSQAVCVLKQTARMYAMELEQLSFEI